MVGQLSKNDRIEDLHTAIKTLIDEVVSSREEMVKASKREASIAMSRSVAHDIRSPLAALNVLAKISTDLPEDQRHILQNATERITDIANNLLESHRDTSNVDELKPELLSGLIETVISEKRLQFSSQKNVSIQFSLDSISFGIFSKIRKSEFKRVISNLIDNAVESLEGSGTVTVEIFRGGGKNQIVIKDTGVGIPAHVLTKLGKEEVTFGKSSNTSGHGLGVLNAVKTIRSWGGELDFNSHPSGRGTEAFITLPDVVAPDWFLNELNLSRTTDVVVLDDERSIHSIWGSRLDKRTNIRHAYSPDEFSQMVEASSAGTTFLCDFELLGHKQTGADLIRKLGIEDRSILVTSRFEDDNVVEDCLDLKIKLLPKNLVSVVPIIQ
ncbi:MAG: hypothetical protein CL677_07550 [Bdellovibrionaceae bacterium]|nr:hypothetical protein [Pseudobdellovibrionaceae bacterium]